MNKCPTCGKESNDVYCPQCGTPMVPSDSGYNASNAYGAQNGSYDASSSYGQSSYNQNGSYDNSAYGQSQNGYGQSSYDQSQNGYGQSSYGQNPNGYGQNQGNSDININLSDLEDTGKKFLSGNIGSYEPEGMNIPFEYRPISMWGYFGYMILFAIPCIGFIMTCVFAFGGTQNINLKNFARSQFCGLIVAVCIFLFFILLSGMGACSSMMYYYR